MLTAVFAALSAATLLLGTPEYRFNILVAPRIIHSEFSLLHAWRFAKVSIIVNAYWIVAPVALLLTAGARRIDNTVRMLMTVFAIAMVAGLIAMGTPGATDNYLLEAFVAGSTLLQIAVFAIPGGIVSSMVLIGCVQPALQLATAPSERQLFGRLQLATVTEYADAMALRDRLAPMKKPIFTTDETFALPWISTGNRAPALIVDYKLYDATRLRYQNGGIEGMLQKGDIPTVILRPRDTPFKESMNPNYMKAGELFHQGDLYNIYVISDPAISVHSPVR
jgi:hypothetical protein